MKEHGVILQSEIKALLRADAAIRRMAYELHRRASAGAGVQAGGFRLQFQDDSGVTDRTNTNHAYYNPGDLGVIVNREGRVVSVALS